ncbi:hypothetical protein CEXT_95571 [Caerostris extrusa]|uniref:Uncharacterized protein n=1 Tax=Caerostris extrusa TaxID=172846 RepID=A0AAV4VF53_CAEEX|nr:hypothetical protein CEXT_95571 [Caerostris extrusa]
MHFYHNCASYTKQDSMKCWTGVWSLKVTSLSLVFFQATKHPKFTFLHNSEPDTENQPFNGKFGSPFLAIYNRAKRQHTENSIFIGQWLLFQNAHNSILGYLHLLLPPLQTHAQLQERIPPPPCILNQ